MAKASADTLTIGKLSFDYTDSWGKTDVYSADKNLNELSRYNSPVPLKDFPKNALVQIHSSDGFGTDLFYELNIKKQKKSFVLEFICHQPNKHWEGKWGLATLLNAIKTQIKFNDLSIGEIETEDDWKRLTLIKKINSNLRLFSHIKGAAQEIKDLINQSEIYLSGAGWKKKYEKNEAAFCNEIITPLLRRIGFLSVSYKHGKREYGKDYTFSEMTPFGEMRHCGLQVKAGDVRGNVNSDIDEIIGQLDDAFRMPYVEINSSEERYISTFIVAISGFFTENAKEKIAKKIPKGKYGSVYFLDKEKILELIERYWRQR